MTFDSLESEAASLADRLSAKRQFSITEMWFVPMLQRGWATTKAGLCIMQDIPDTAKNILALERKLTEEPEAFRREAYDYLQEPPVTDMGVFPFPLDLLRLAVHAPQCWALYEMAVAEDKLYNPTTMRFDSQLAFASR